MPRQAKVVESTVPAVGAMWNMDPEAMYKAWMNQTIRMRDETLRFAQERFTKELDAAARLIRCANPTEVFAVQAEYANTMAADYFAEGQKLVELMGEMATEISPSPRPHRAHHS
jgi:Phasin protein